MTFTDLKRIYKGFGFSSVIHALNYSLRNKVSLYSELQGMIVTMDSLDPKYLETNPKYEHKFLNEEELKKFSKNPETQISEFFLNKALPKGDRCFAILDGDFLASYGWYSTKPTAISDEIDLHFDPQWVYMYKGYTHPNYRGQRLHAVGMAKALETVSSEGSKGLISYVATNNYASLKSVYRMGYRNIGKVKVSKIINKYHIKREDACKPYGLNVIPS